MAYSYGCEGTYPIAAIGSVAGSFAYSCPGPYAVSVMEIHGLDDRNIAFAGGDGVKSVIQVQWLQVERTIDALRLADRCRAPSPRQRGPVRTENSLCTDGREVVLITIAGAGHQWPGGRKYRRLVTLPFNFDPPSQALDATSALWDFLKRHPAP